MSRDFSPAQDESNDPTEDTEEDGIPPFGDPAMVDLLWSGSDRWQFR